ncbi:MAG: helix-turn-helix transcriptional regulator, partial [Longimicrobiales bacterium]
MPMGDWRERLLATTRGRVVALLRRSAQTVNDLAGKLDLTNNAVRLHLSALERDGLVEQHGTRREWTGKPAFVYRTTREAEGLFPKPYGIVLAEVLTLLQQRHPPEEIVRLLREIGSRLGREQSSDADDPRERARHAAEVLTELGGLAEVEEEEGGLRLQGYSCPLGEVTAAHPVTCQLAEALVSEVVGAPVTERCDRGDRPRCA